MKAVRNNLLSSKRAQDGVFGLSFGMIFSIILIVFFFIGAFMGIRAFLSYQKCALLNIFVGEVQQKVDEAWNSQSASFRFNSSLPSGVEYICFINLSAPANNTNPTEKAIYDDILAGYYEADKNLHIYAPKKDYCLKWKTIKHLDLAKKNPVCAKVTRNIVSIKVERTFDSPLVKVSA